VIGALWPGFTKDPPKVRTGLRAHRTQSFAHPVEAHAPAREGPRYFLRATDWTHPDKSGGELGDHVYKTIEITGSSTSGVDAAINGAIVKASETVRNLDWFEVTEIRGHIENGAVAHVQVGLKIGFRLE